jgi:hypothetical protein
LKKPIFGILTFLGLVATLQFGVMQHVYAEEFLGEDENSSSDSDGSSGQVFNYDKPSSDVVEPAQPDSYSGQMYFSLGLSPGVGTFSGSFTAGYLINRYVVIDTTAYYTRIDHQDESGEQYGPEVSLILRLANPTILTPFIGAGLGYSRWKFLEDKEQFDDGGSVMAIAFGGVNIKLTKNFGLQLKRKQTAYLADPPRTFADHDKRQERTAVATTIGFYAAF